MKNRLNITLPKDVREALIKSARRQQLPPATQATRLLEMALEMEEDQLWGSMAQKRDTKDAKYMPLKQD